ncbi:MAG TPA: hypothetical protein VFK54_05455 [Candidatus Limnocylindrales bacterium]|nr:hypothetical protein [Candidatus Limnocylindrales bacterium]
MSRSPASALALSVLALLLTACGPARPTDGSPATLGPATTLAPDLTAVPGGATPSGPPTTTETDWGTIVDRLPAGFPVHPEAVPIEAPGGAVSGAFAVGAPGPTLTEWYQSALELAGYSTVALSGPLEDGSTVIESVGPTSTACRIQTTITPLSGTTRVTILVDAACEP